MGFSRQEYWSGLPFPSPGDLPNQGLEPRSPALQADSLLSEPLGEAPYVFILWVKYLKAKLLGHVLTCQSFFFAVTTPFWASQVVLVVNNSPANVGDVRDVGLIPGLGKSTWGGHGNPLQYFCLENPCGQRSLVGYSLWGGKELDMTEATEHACSMHTILQSHLLTLLLFLFFMIPILVGVIRYLIVFVCLMFIWLLWVLVAACRIFLVVVCKLLVVACGI